MALDELLLRGSHLSCVSAKWTSTCKSLSGICIARSRLMSEAKAD